METVNIGCGEDRWGDVRLDIRKTFNPTIVGDAQNLPFKSDAFKVAKISHVLEHVNYPVKALKECMRVARTLEIYLPTETDLYPALIRYLFSLPFSVRGVLEWCRHRRVREHKWMIKPIEIVVFLAENGWEQIFFSKEKQTRLLSIFDGKRTPKQFKYLVKYVPYIGSQYVIIAKKNEEEEMELD